MTVAESRMNALEQATQPPPVERRKPSVTGKSIVIAAFARIGRGDLSPGILGEPRRCRGRQVQRDAAAGLACCARRRKSPGVGPCSSVVA